VVKLIEQLNESIKQYPLLMDAEESAKVIAPDCSQFTPKQLAEIRRGDAATLSSHKTQLQLNEASLTEYKTQLDKDYSLSLTIDHLLTTFLSHFQNHLKSQADTIALLNQLLSSTKKLHTKLDQRMVNLRLEVDSLPGSYSASYHHNHGDNHAGSSSGLRNTNRPDWN